MLSVLLLALLLPVPALACDLAPGAPPPVLSLRQVRLSPEERAAEHEAWQQYVQQHPDDAVALVQLHRAKRYSGRLEGQDGSLLDRALELGPDCALVLIDYASHYFGASLHGGEPGMAKVRSYLERALQLDPSSHEAHWSLAVIDMVFGKHEDAARHYRAIVELGGIPTPLLDFGYNLLVAAEPGAIILTNGDNDTMAPMAVQALHAFRPDVRIVNLSLLHLKEYARHYFAAELGPFEWSEVEEIAGQDPGLLSWNLVAELQKRIEDGRWRQPVYLALTVYPGAYRHLDLHLQRQGLLLRMLPSKPQFELDLETTDALLHETYRLESATDLGFPWGPRSSISEMVESYLSLYYRLATAFAKQGILPGVRRNLNAALEFLIFHDEIRYGENGDQMAKLVQYWEEVDPDNPKVAFWKKRLAR